MAVGTADAEPTTDDALARFRDQFGPGDPVRATRHAIADELRARGWFKQADRFLGCPIARAYRDQRDAGHDHEPAIRRLADDPEPWADEIEAITGKRPARLEAHESAKWWDTVLEESVEHIVTRWGRCRECKTQVPVPELCRSRLCATCTAERRARLYAQDLAPLASMLERAAELAGQSFGVRMLTLTVKNPDRDALTPAVADARDDFNALLDAPIRDAVDALDDPPTFRWYERERRARRSPDHPDHHGCAVCTQGHTHRDSDCSLEDPDAHRPVTWRDALKAGLYSVESNHKWVPDTWNLHLHVGVVSPYLPAKILSKAWHLVTGDSRVVWVNATPSHNDADARDHLRDATAEDVAREVLKYVAKTPEPIPDDLDADALGNPATEAQLRERAEAHAEILADWWEAYHKTKKYMRFGWLHANHARYPDLESAVEDDPNDAPEPGLACPECGSEDITFEPLDPGDNKDPPWQCLRPQGFAPGPSGQY